MKKRILVVGSMFTDFVMHVDRVPLANEITTEYGGRETIAGGAGLNAAAAFSRLGADTVLCSRIGADAQGIALKKAASKFGVDTRFIYEDRTGKSGFNAIMAESSGITRTASYPGVAMRITDSDVEEALTSYPDGVYLTLELNPKTIVSTLELASDMGAPVFLSATPANVRFPFDRLPRLEAFICSAEEAYEYTRILPDTVDSCLRTAIKLSSMVEARFYVIKLGERGFYVYDGTYQHVSPATEIPVVDARGVDEVFGAALALGYLESRNIEYALKYANIASAVTGAKAGRCSSYPTNEEIEKFIDENDID